MAKTNIEWTETTWNPITGCDKISQGCKFCYAEVMAKRLKAMRNKRYSNGFKLTLHWDKIQEPLSWKKPRMVFVNSMSDMFHENVPIDFIKQVFKVMKETPHITYQVLTKRSKRLSEISEQLDWGDNVWMGVSVENEEAIYRIDNLRKCGANVKFISAEPLIGNLPELNLIDIDWMIVGGESGFTPRPIKESWVLEIRDQCKRNNVAFFFKQWGGKNKKTAGRILKGKTYDEMPKVA